MFIVCVCEWKRFYPFWFGFSLACCCCRCCSCFLFAKLVQRKGDGVCIFDLSRMNVHIIIWEWILFRISHMDTLLLLPLPLLLLHFLIPFKAVNTRTQCWTVTPFDTAIAHRHRCCRAHTYTFRTQPRHFSYFTNVCIWFDGGASCFFRLLAFGIKMD